jgi:hypothetical protein
MSHQPEVEWINLCDSGTCAQIHYGSDVVKLRHSDRPDDVVSFTHEEWTQVLANLTRKS